MFQFALVFFLCSLLLWALHYWLIVITEGVFFGRRFVLFLYDREADKYDDIKEYRLQDEEILVVEPILGELGATKRPLLLDVGSGTGRVPHFLLADGRFVNERHGHIIGLEPSGQMLRHATHHVSSFLPHVSWVQQTAVPLPFASNSFDGVTSLETIEFFPKPAEALREMVRVLKPGGFLMITRRREWEAYAFLNRYFSQDRYKALLRELGLQEVGIFLWQNNYDLVIGEKRKDKG